MEMHIHIHVHHEQDRVVIQKLNSILNTVSNMPTKQEFQAVIDGMSASIDNIAGDIQRLTEQLQTGGLTDAEEQDIFSQLQAKATQLQGIADQTQEPGTGGETPQP